MIAATFLNSSAAEIAFMTHFGLFVAAICLGLFLLTLAWNGYSKRRRAWIEERLPKHGHWYRQTGRGSVK